MPADRTKNAVAARGSAVATGAAIQAPAPADRAEVLHRLAVLREEAAERHAELAHLESDTTDTHQAAAAQARDRAPRPWVRRPPRPQGAPVGA